MSKYSIEKETMDGIAVQSMAIAGKTAGVTPAEITADLTAANAEIGNQSALIAQIKAALEGKAAGGSGLPSGILEIKTGSWKQATNDSTGSFTIPHGCSKKPLFVLVTSDYLTSGATAANSIQALASLAGVDGDYSNCMQNAGVANSNSSLMLTFDDTNMVFTNYSSQRWQQGNTYTWYAIAMKD